MPEPGIKRSLVLAGGGMRLAYHAGVLRALEDAGIAYGHVDGTSGGIFAAAMLASGQRPAEIAARWRALKLSGFVSALPFRKYLRPLMMPAFASADGISKKIFPALGISIPKINHNAELKATFNVCNFSHKTVESISHRKVTERHLIAGMSLPIFMPAILIDGSWYTDAVWIKDANLLEALNHDPDEIWLVWCIGNTKTYHNGAFLQYVQMIEMSATGGLHAELEWLAAENEKRLMAGRKEIEVHVIKPEYALPLDPDFFLHRVDADTLINMGYADTVAYLKQKNPLELRRRPYQCTAMKESGNYVHFRQQFTGEALIAGEKVRLTLHLAIFLRESEDGFSVQQYISLQCRTAKKERLAGGEGEEWWVSGANAKTQLGKGWLIGEFDLVNGDSRYHLKYSLYLSAVLDLYWGLAFKMAFVVLEDEHGLMQQFNLSQSAWKRIQNAFYRYTHSKASWFKRLAIRKKLLLKLIQ